MTTPCLTRQNAFLVEDNEQNSPLDLFCGICHEAEDSVTSITLIRPCQCLVQQKPYFAHENCFLDWSIKNGHPKYCTACKSRYRLRKDYTKYKNATYIILTIIWIILIYLFQHTYSCATMETMDKSEIETSYGDSTFKDVPDQVLLPRISAECFNSAFASIPAFLISPLDAVCTICLSILISILIAEIAYQPER